MVKSLLPLMTRKSATGAATTVTTLGMTASTMTDDLRERYKVDEKLKGAVITEVAKEGAATEKGIEVGDVIMEAGGKPVEMAADISQPLKMPKKAGKYSVSAADGQGRQIRRNPVYRAENQKVRRVGRAVATWWRNCHKNWHIPCILCIATLLCIAQ